MYMDSFSPSLLGLDIYRNKIGMRAGMCSFLLMLFP